jgi:putative spermidine/putrescine transport system substrate-binding protein
LYACPSCADPSKVFIELMNRRSLLFGLGAIALGLSGCRRATSALQVSLLARALPSQLVSKFRSAAPGTDVKLSIAPSLQQLFTGLQQQAVLRPEAQQPNLFQRLSQFIFGAPETISRVSMLGDYWLSVAIAQELIRPLPLDRLQGWTDLAPQWQRLVKRDRQGRLSETGEVWGAPYRWGATVIAYRKAEFRKLGWTPTDWGDLWRPELQGKISLLDQPRETIGLTLKKLKRSYNETNLAAVPNLISNLQALDRQVKLYSSTDYLQPLLLKDTWVAVGWSTDILALAESEPDIGFAVPQSGTALWSDVWVWPMEADSSKAKFNQEWIEFWWKPDVAKALTQFTDALSPALKELGSNNATKADLAPNQSWFEQSEFLEPLPAVALNQYQSLWKQMRT